MDICQTPKRTFLTCANRSIGRLIGCEKKVNGETVLRTWQEFNEHNQQTYYGYQMGDESYSESYTYNADGTLNQIVGNDGRTVTMSYDGLRRLSSKTVKQGDTAVVSYTYSYRDISETATTTQIASVQVTAPTGQQPMRIPTIPTAISCLSVMVRTPHPMSTTP